MSTTKKWLVALLSVLTVALAVGLSACQPYEPAETTQPPHEHTFSSDWSKDGTHHWHASTCGHDVTDDRGEHSFAEATCTAPKTCSTCGATEGDPLGHTGGTATCTDKAVCTRCEQPYGDPLGHNEDATSTDAKYIKTNASCTAAAVYYKSCSRCGAAGTATFTSGDPAPHTPEDKAMPGYLKTPATCQAAAVYYKSCSVCNHALTETFTSGALADCKMTAKNTESAFLKTAANCQSPAVYYYSCEVCGEKSTTETFTSGSVNAENHTSREFTYLSNENGTHTKKNACCGATVDADENCNGTATCEVLAHCSLCDTDHGTKAQHNMIKEDTASKYRKSAATCASPAVYYKSCEVCGEKSTTETFTSGNALGHVGGTATCEDPAICTRCSQPYGNTAAHSFADATCTVAKTCAACGATEGEPAGHKWDDATCTTPKTCSTCGETEGDPQHTWNDGVVTTPATCTTAGVKTYTCTVGTCGTQRTETIAATGHSYTEAVTAPTCTSAGYTTFTCQNGTCGDSYEGAPTEPLGHTWDRDRTCTLSHKCSVCQTEEAALGHSYTSAVTAPATCTTKGTETFTCSRGCGDSYGTDIPVLGHLYKTEPEKNYNGTTCEYVEAFPCQRDECGYVKTGESVSHHNYAITYDPEATCQNAGLRVYTCTVTGCDSTYNENVLQDPNAHVWVKGEAEAGMRTDSCSVEGCDVTKEVIVASGEMNTSNLADTELAVGDVSMTLDQGTIGSIEGNVTLGAESYDKDQALPGNITLTQDQKDKIGENKIYNFTMEDQSGAVESFGDGQVKITIPYTLQPNEDANSIAIWYVTSEGVTAIPATYANGYVTFYTSHFSCYTVTKLSPEEMCAAFGHDYEDTTVLPTCTTAGYTISTCKRCGDVIQKDPVNAQGHDYVVANESLATCTTAGTKTYDCSRCDDGYVEYVSATGHSYIAGDPTPATCAAAGSQTFTCVCGVSYTTILSRLAHDYEESTVDPTCTTDGYTQYACSMCNAEYKTGFKSPTGHAYVKSFVWSEDLTSATLHLTCEHDCGFSEDIAADVVIRTVPATCAAFGKVTYSARVSYNGVFYADAKSQELPKTEHTYSAGWASDENGHYHVCVCGEISDLAAHDFEEFRTEASCGIEGEVLSICRDCSYAKLETIPALTHKYNRVETPATCTKPGSVVDTCEYCGDKTLVNTIPVVSHSYGEGVITTPATCIASGIRTYTCADCGKTKTEAIAIVEHEYDTVTVPATCGKDGMTSEICSTCGDKHVTVLPATGEHAYIHEVIVKPATCTTAGEKAQTCDCGAKKTEQIPATGHTYDKGTVTEKATCVKDGKIVYTCACGDSKTEILPATGQHNYMDGVCTDCGAKAPTDTPVEPPVTDCDHTPVTTEVIDLKEIGACGGKITIYTCACGKKTFNQREMSEILCDMNDGAEEERPTVNPDGSQYQKMTATCKKCGLYAEIEGTMKPDGCMAYVTYTLTIRFGDKLLVDHATYEDSFSNHGEYEQKQILISETCKTYFDVTTCKTCGEVVHFGALTSGCVGKAVESTYEKDGVKHTLITTTCETCGVVHTEDTYAAAQDGCYTIYRVTVTFKSGDKVIYTGTTERSKGNHDYVEISRQEATCTQEGRVTYECRNCGSGIGEASSKLPHTYVDGKCTVCGTAQGADPIEIEIFRAEQIEKIETMWGELCEQYPVTDEHWTAFETIIRGIRKAPTIDAIKDYAEKFQILAEEVRSGAGSCAHQWKEVEGAYVAPTCVMPGYRQMHCELCGNQRLEQIPATGKHNYDADGVCTVCGGVEGELPPINEIEERRNEILSYMEEKWNGLLSAGFLYTPDQQKEYAELRSYAKNAESLDELEVAHDRFVMFIDKIGAVVKDHIVSVTPNFEPLSIPLNADIKAFLDASLVGKTLTVTMSQSGAIVIPITMDMLKYNGNTEALGNYVSVSIQYQAAGIASSYAFSMPVVVDLSGAALLGTYDASCIYGFMDGMTIEITLYDNGWSEMKVTMVTSDGTAQSMTQQMQYTREGDVATFDMGGVKTLFRVDEDAKSMTPVVPTGDTIGVYTLTEHGMTTTLTVYGTYTTAGEYMASIYLKDDEMETTLTVYVMLDLENRTLTSETIGGSYKFDDTGMLYCDHNWIVIHQRPATCTEAGYTEYRCENCREYEMRDHVPATGHSFNENGICQNCGMSNGTDENVNSYRAALREQMQMEWDGILAIGIPISEVYHLRYQNLLMKLESAPSSKELSAVKDMFYELLEEVKKNGDTTEKKEMYHVTVYETIDEKTQLKLVYTFYSDHTVHGVGYRITSDGREEFVQEAVTNWVRENEFIYIIVNGVKEIRFFFTADGELVFDDSFDGGGDITPPTEDRIQSIRDEFGTLHIYVGKNVTEYLQNNLVGKTMTVTMQSGTVYTVTVQEGMYRIMGGDSSEIGNDIDIQLDYKLENGQGGTHYFSIPVVYDVNAEEKLGDYDASCIYNNMEGMGVTITLYSNGWAEMYAAMGPETQYQQLNYTLNEGLLMLHIDGVECYFTVNEEAKALASYEAAGDVLGTYVYRTSYMSVTFTVFGPYTTAGDYFAKLLIMGGEMSSAMTIKLFYDRENMILRSDVINGEFKFDESGKLYHEHKWIEIGKKAPTCMSRGYTEYRCETCGQREERDYVDPIGHSFNDNGICSYCGMSNGGYPTECKHEFDATGICIHCGMMGGYVPPACNHDYKYTVIKMNNGESCEGGVDFKATCKMCGESYSGSSIGHFVEQEGVNLMDAYGLCDTHITIETCLLCNEVSNVWLNYWNCQFDGRGEGYGDEAGVYHNVHVQTCSVCHLTVREENYTIPGENCTATNYRMITITILDENGNSSVLYSSTSSSTGEDHNYREVAEIPEGGSCADGYTYYLRCEKCGDETEHYTTNGGVCIWEVRDEPLLAEGFCGGSVNLSVCARCGAYRYVNSPSYDCWSTMQVTTREEVRDGETHRIVTRTCSACMAVVVEDWWITDDSTACVHIQNLILRITTEGGGLVFDKTYTWEDTTHDYNREYIPYGSDCEVDGYKVVVTCKNCDAGYTDENCMGHVTGEYTWVSLAQHGFCNENMRYAAYLCKACGKVVTLDPPNEYCPDSYSSRNTRYENGMLYESYIQFCPTCGITVEMITRYEPNGNEYSPCDVKGHRTLVITRDGVELERIEAIGCNEYTIRHTIEFEYIDGECGGTYQKREYCVNCDYENIYYVYDHDVEWTTDYIASFGGCTRTYVSSGKCMRCGEVTYFHVMTDGCEIGDPIVEEITVEATGKTATKYTYTCTRCGLTYSEYSYVLTETEGEETRYYRVHYLSVYVGEQHVITCDRREEISADEAHEHTWTKTGEWQFSTCEMMGWEEYSCECGQVKTELLPYAEHSYGDDGYCIWCRVSISGEPETPACEHEWVYTTVKEPTCAEYGQRDAQCTKCGETHPEQIEKLAHSVVEESFPYEDACGGNAQAKIGKCFDCGYIQDMSYSFSCENTTTELRQITLSDGVADIGVVSCSDCGYEYYYHIMYYADGMELHVMGVMKNGEEVLSAEQIRPVEDTSDESFGDVTGGDENVMLSSIPV